MSTNIAILLGIGLLGILIGLDIYLAADGVEGNTWSEILRQWSVITPVVPFIYGVLGGHFYHPVDGLDPIVDTPGNIALLVWVTVLIGVIGILTTKHDVEIAPWIPVIPGFIAGCFLWPV
jgi:hypothetical protein